MDEPNRREQIEMVANILGHLALSPAPTLGLDLDGVLDEAPAFFSILTKVWPGKVIIITFRDDRAKAEADLARLGIRFDDLVLVRSFGQKAEIIVEKGVAVFVDDQPEVLKHVPPTVSVMLFRNEGNYSHEKKLWTLSKDTGRLI